MSSFLLPATALVVLAFWICLAADRRRRWPHELALPRPPDGPARDDAGLERRVVAIVPARDEAEQLPWTLPQLLAQQDLRAVVLVDDGSTDGTAEVARRLAAERVEIGGPALEVVAAPPRPPGWAGKVHAQAVGFALARSRFADAEWLLLTDADIRHRAGSVGALLAQAERGYDLVSVMARLRTHTLWEKLLIPAFVYFFQLLYPFREVPRAGSRTAAAAGGCVLLRRDALERAGGFAAIRTRLIDDVALAKAVAAVGGRPWLGLDPGIESVRPYPGLGDLWRMVARSAFVQLDYRWSLVLGVLAGLLLFFVSPPLGALLGLVWAAAAPDGVSAPWSVASASFFTAWMLQTAQLLPAVRHHRLRWWWALLLPAASLLYGAMTLSSALAHRRGSAATWRGRRYGRVDAEG